jgi:hypothetical protein
MCQKPLRTKLAKNTKNKTRQATACRAKRTYRLMATTLWHQAHFAVWIVAIVPTIVGMLGHF